MDKIINIKSKYYNYLLKKLIPVKGNESFTYKLVLNTTEDVVKTGYEANNFYIKLLGGPTLMEGNSFENAIIKSIIYSYELETYIITFK